MLRLIFGAFLLLQLPSFASAAKTSPRARARALFEQGMVRYRERNFDAAITSWQAGYQLAPLAAFLFNIAQAYQVSERPDKALSFYRNYLAQAPRAPNRQQVQELIALLSVQVGTSERSTPPSGATQRGSPPEATEKSTAPAPEPAHQGAQASSTAEPSAPVAAEDHPKSHRPKWVWWVVGTAAVLVIGAVAVGVAVGTQSSSIDRLPTVRF